MVEVALESAGLAEGALLASDVVFRLEGIATSGSGTAARRAHDPLVCRPSSTHLTSVSRWHSSDGIE